MAQAPKKQDKPADPPYPGGEDEDMKSGPEVKEPPVDETDDSPSNGRMHIADTKKIASQRTMPAVLSLGTTGTKPTHDLLDFWLLKAGRLAGPQIRATSL